MGLIDDLFHVSESGPGLGLLRERLEDLIASEVLVGIPEAETYRDEIDEEMTNAALLYFHTHGSPLQNIPARPVIEPAIEASDNKEHIMAEFAKAARSAMQGDPDEMERHLNLAGQEGENAARGWFEDPRNAWPPNSPATIIRKGSDRPLIDTGQLRKSIVYVIRSGK